MIFPNQEPLEDSAQDVLQKAEAIASALGRADASTLLQAEALQLLQTSNPHPGPLEVPECLRILTTDYLGMRVNCFLVLVASQQSAILFDTGADARSVLRVLEKENCSLQHILITHAHGDHVAVLEELQSHTGAKIGSFSYYGYNIVNGQQLELCGLQIHAFHLPGHATDALAYFLPQLQPPLLVSGDAIFARSLGRVHHNHSQAIGDILSLLRALPPHTVILPGHGPLTTIEQELRYNPFLAGR